MTAKNVSDSLIPDSRGPRLPVELPDDSPDALAHKRAVRARMIEEAADVAAKAALRRAVAVSLKAKLAALTGPERDLLLERLVHAGGIPSNILGEIRDLGAP